jgi:diazepam-binding inhibitor (GABA receptor modulating acyl-CoA-binding protein)
MDSYPLAKHFEAVADKIKTYGTEMKDADKLKVYGLFKQATVGDNTTSQPWKVQLEARAKWDAWDAEKGKSSDQAKHEYVDYALKFFPSDVKANFSA